MDSAEKINGYIQSAIDMEDSFTRGVYTICMERKNWPANIDEETFLEIKSLLKTLVNDSANHKEIFLGLKKRVNEK
ncbi:MAG: hypothetical protein FVQ80_12785 [Planctomycetes bacterium]|nr:hypothetical protein [Planctomycetota bacterium]